MFVASCFSNCPRSRPRRVGEGRNNPRMRGPPGRSAIVAAMNASLRLGWRTLWRDLRAGELRLLIVAVLLAVAALTAVGFFADRLQGGLKRDARQLLGGDAVIVSDNPTPEAFVAQARSLGLQSAGTYGFPTMARADDARGGASKLVALKAVAEGYPLRGNVQTATALGAPGAVTRDVPAPGEVWVDASLLDSLALKVGGGWHSYALARLLVDRCSGGVVPKAVRALSPRARHRLLWDVGVA